ncbi:hypothetical protein K3495_g7043 [Podosphaera aphanis]|nr:hypothetical protein K3495_g7043 [Podosphaera aphanis]
MDNKISPTVRRRAPFLSRDQRIQILALQRAGISNREIADQIGVTITQDQGAVRFGRVSPQPRTGRPPSLSSAQVDEMETFVCSCREIRQMSFLELALHFRRRCPRLSENHRSVRLLWAEQHLSWRQEWSQVLWSDETWINDDRIMSGHVTRKRGEEFDDTCVVDQYKKNNSWMFWGSFAGVERGPCIFWERDRGNMPSEKYALRILLLVVDWTRAKSEEIGRQVYFMHENAAVQKGCPTREYLHANGVESIPWPANSPDLNPIENVWSMMKYYIQEWYPEFDQTRQRNREEVRSIVLEAWYHSTTVEKLSSLMESMSRRCQEVIGADGGPIPY